MFNFPFYQNNHACLRFYKDGEACGTEKIFLASKLYGGIYSASRPGRFNPEKERSLNMRLGWRQIWSGCCKEHKITCPCL